MAAALELSKEVRDEALRRCWSCSMRRRCSSVIVFRPLVLLVLPAFGFVAVLLVLVVVLVRDRDRFGDGGGRGGGRRCRVDRDGGGVGEVDRDGAVGGGSRRGGGDLLRGERPDVVPRRWRSRPRFTTSAEAAATTVKAAAPAEETKAWRIRMERAP